MMTDDLRERIAEVLELHASDAYSAADAVLAVLPEYEQVGWMAPTGSLWMKRMYPSEVPVYIRKEPTDE